jgi:beta-1,4-mannosyl-glycoprotein beta-1,4-N-acetylglucosaminyltransferase
LGSESFPLLMKIFDTFVYSGEKKLLRARLNHLKPYVDCFVIVESKFTFSGLPREIDLAFREEVLLEYGTKIRWFVLDELRGENAWERETLQRQSLNEGLYDIQPGDVVLLSDVDEIPSPSFIKSSSRLEYGDVLIAEMKLFRYCQHHESIDKWYGTVAIRHTGNLIDMQHLRMRAIRYWLEEVARIFANGGTHFTTFLTARQFKEKIKSFSHTELNVFPFNTVAFLQLIIKLGITLDGKEILKLSRELETMGTYRFCSSDHKFDNFRIKIARLIQPTIQNIFLSKVKNLSIPN